MAVALGEAALGEPRRISRREAIEQGFRTYYTGVGCPRGHVADRYTSSKMCLVCMREKHLVYRATAAKRKEEETVAEDLDETESKNSLADHLAYHIQHHVPEVWAEFSKIPGQARRDRLNETTATLIELAKKLLTAGIV